MDILIKSFNRPYYLDRCLFSIKKHVKNNDGKIVILDDGTPPIYLNKITEKYPYVTIKKSESYDLKQQFTTKGICPSTYEIPIKLWIEGAREATENFIMLEDDIWFTDDFDCLATVIDIKSDNVMMTKLHWLGNSIINQNKYKTLKNNLILIKPKLFTIVPALYYLIFYKFDKFKIRKTFRFLRINTRKKHLAYYSIYAVAGVIFNREYFLKLWANHENKIDEGLQIYNAVKIYQKNKNTNQFAIYKNEILKTGFTSSATNQYKEHYLGNVDMFIFNKMLNDAWLSNQLDTIKSLPKDIDIDSINHILNNNSNSKITATDWQNWMQDFKTEYRVFGCIID